MIHLLEKLFNLTSSAMLMPFIIISVIAAIAPIIVFIIIIVKFIKNRRRFNEVTQHITSNIRNAFKPKEKFCAYCGSKAKENEEKCNNCGSTTYIMK